MIEKVLVTGGAGFIGSHAAAYYDTKGIDVVVLDNFSRKDTLNTVSEESDSPMHNGEYLRHTHQDIEHIEGDIREYDTVVDAVEGCDGIVHTAGQVAVTSSLSDPVTDFVINARGTLNILEAARTADSDPGLVFASTNKVYGNNVNTIPTAEQETRYVYDDPQYTDGIPETFCIDDTEHTPYGVSKLAADLYVQDYAERGEVDAAVFRMSCIYGDRQFGNEDQGWVAHFLLSVLEDDPLTIFGNGKQVRDVLHVSDLVRAYDSFLSDPANKPSIYNIGGGSDITTSLLEFLDLLEAKTGNSPSLTFDEWREGDQRVYISDIARAREELNWEPTVSFEEGVEQFLEWYETSDRGKSS